MSFSQTSSRCLEALHINGSSVVRVDMIVQVGIHVSATCHQQQAVKQQNNIPPPPSLTPRGGINFVSKDLQNFLEAIHLK